MRFFRKIKSKNGETISETLVATLIAAISMIIFASMVIASKNIIKNSEETIAHYYRQKSEMEIQSDDIKTYTGTIEITKAPVYDKKSYSNVKIYSSEESESSEDDGLTIYSY